MDGKRIKCNWFPVRSKFLVRASYMQIYNETISDLLKEGQGNLTIREDSRRGVFVDGLSEWVVRSAAEVYGLMERGTEMVRLKVACASGEAEFGVDDFFEISLRVYCGNSLPCVLLYRRMLRGIEVCLQNPRLNCTACDHPIISFLSS